MRRRVTLSGHVIDALWQPLAILALALIAGRVLLAFLPPGRPGGHSPRELPATLAASLLCGTGVLLGLSFVAEGFWTLALLVCAAGAAVRAATLPADIVPRNEPARERSRLASGVFLLALVPACLAWPALNDDAELFALELAHRLALVLLVVCVEHGLATARRAPLARRLFVLVLALSLYREHPSAASMSELVERISAAGFGAGAAFALVWLRRADRRSAVLAIVCFVVGRPWSDFEGVILAGVALLALVVCTPRPSRPWIARVSAIGLALCLAPALHGMAWAGFAPEESPLPGLARLALVIATLCSAAWIVRSIVQRGRREPAEDRAALARGDRFLLLLGVLACGVCWLLPAAAGTSEGASGMQVVAPVAFLLAGCVSIRPERGA